jgi:transposase-like protein
MNQVITIKSTMLSKYCMIFCPICETTVRHALGSSEQIYVCGSCANVVDVEIEENEDETLT